VLITAPNDRSRPIDTLSQNQKMAGDDVFSSRVMYATKRRVDMLHCNIWLHRKCSGLSQVQFSAFDGTFGMCLRHSAQHQQRRCRLVQWCLVQRMQQLW